MKTILKSADPCLKKKSGQASTTKYKWSPT